MRVSHGLLLSSLRALKEHTQELHLLAEQYVRILDADAGRDDYVRYLRAMLGFHAPTEETFVAHDGLAAAGFEARRRRKSHLLLADLRALDPCLSILPRCTAMPELASVERALGAAYVIEGSTLGGKYILAHLPPELAALRGTATAFLEGYGSETGALWKSFGATVERTIRDADAERELLAGAHDAFARLIDWLAVFEERDARRERRAS